VDQAVFQDIVGDALKCPMSNDDRGASQACHLWMANVDILAVGYLQPERFEGSVIETFFYGSSEHITSLLL